MAKILHPNNSSIHSHPRWADFFIATRYLSSDFHFFFALLVGGDDLGAGDFSITQQIAVRYLGVLRLDCGSLRIQEYLDIFWIRIFLELYCGFWSGIVLGFFGNKIQPFGVKDIKSMLQKFSKTYDPYFYETFVLPYSFYLKCFIVWNGKIIVKIVK